MTNAHNGQVRSVLRAAAMDTGKRRTASQTQTHFTVQYVIYNHAIIPSNGQYTRFVNEKKDARMHNYDNYSK